MPDNIIFVDEQLIKKISSINIGILEETQKLFGSTKYSLNTAFTNLINDEVIAKIEGLIEQMTSNDQSSLNDES